MARVLEGRQKRGGPTRRGIWINPSNYERSEEGGPNLDLWAALANPVALRRGVASDFASAAGALDGVDEVWLVRVFDDLHIAVALNDPTAESKLRDLFIDLVCERLDPSEGELFVYPDGEIPAWIMAGQQLA